MSTQHYFRVFYFPGESVLWLLGVFQILAVFLKKNRFIAESVQKSSQGAGEYFPPIITPFEPFPDHVGPQSSKHRDKKQPYTNPYNNQFVLLRFVQLSFPWPCLPQLCIALPLLSFAALSLAWLCLLGFAYLTLLSRALLIFASLGFRLALLSYTLRG